MAEIRKFDPSSTDELQRLVREQIGDTILPRPAGAPHGEGAADAETDASGDGGPAAADLGTYGSFLSYGDDPRS